MSLEPIPQKQQPGARQARKYLKDFADLFERLAPVGLLPPQSVELEMSILGAMLIDRMAADRVIEILGSRQIDDSPFYRVDHVFIYMAILKLHAKGDKIDILTLTNEMRELGTLDKVGGPGYLVELSTHVVTTTHVEDHAKIILEKFIAREQIRLCEEFKLRLFIGEEDPFHLLNALQQQLFNLQDVLHKRSIQSLEVLAIDAYKGLIAIDDRQKKTGIVGITGIASGLSDLDRMTTGFQNGDLIILAARPSMGKTAEALTWAKNIALSVAVERRLPIAFFSLEMSSGQLVNRLISMSARVDAQKIRAVNMDDAEWAAVGKAIGTLAKGKFFIDDTPAITPPELRAKLRRLVQTEGVKIAFIDYLQLMEGVGKQESREREISTIARSLKSLAKELNIPIIALSQLNRSLESRTNKRPMLSDLRESGAIEQDADLVMFIYRPEVYGIETTTVSESEVDSHGIAELIVAKQRNGPTGTIITAFVAEHGVFENYAWPYATPVQAPAVQESFGPSF